MNPEGPDASWSVDHARFARRGRCRATALIAVAVLATTGLTAVGIARAAPSESVLYAFSTTDGASPNSVARASNGNLFGTAADGGANNLGTVFELTPAGVLTTLHAFDGTDGSSPNSIIEGP